MCDSTDYSWGHAHPSPDGRELHPHVHSNKKAVLNRLARVMGHLDSVRHMIEDDRDCSEVLVQLAAVRSALNNTGKVILQDHISECIVEAVRSGDQGKLDALNQAIAQFVK